MQKISKLLYVAGLIFLGLAAILTVNMTVLAQDEPASTNTLHPTFPLLDSEGVNVLESGNPVSTMHTCGTCHDTGFYRRTQRSCRYWPQPCRKR